VLSFEEPPDEYDHDQAERRCSEPIIFYPNGRTQGARIKLMGENDGYIEVTLRGLTGSAKIDEIKRSVSP